MQVHFSDQNSYHIYEQNPKQKSKQIPKQKSKQNPKIYFDVKIGDGPQNLERIEIELYEDKKSKIVNNFIKKFLSGNQKFEKIRFFNEFQININNDDIYPNDDINTNINTNTNDKVNSSLNNPKQDKYIINKGSFVMYNDSGKSKFYISFIKLIRPNKNHVVIGQVTRGLKVLDAIESTGSQIGHDSGYPSKKVIIIDSGFTSVSS